MKLRHGLAHEPLYKVWKSARHRCTNESSPVYKNYGGRGIKMFGGWLNNPAAFIAWANQAGYSYGMQLDRVDNDGDYSPSNCRFVSSRVNNNNRRNNTLLTAFEETKSLAMWARDERCLITYENLQARVRRGWEPHKALQTPADLKYVTKLKETKNGQFC